MKLISYLRGDQIRVGVIQDGMVADVTEEFSNIHTIIESGNAGLEEIKKILESNLERIPLINDDLLAPIPEVKRNIICVGWNYLKHFNERSRQDIELPERPTVFTKATGTVAGPFESVAISESFTNKFDYEAELAVVIGVGGKNIPENQALNHVFGYMCANDLSARDVQQAHGGQWFLGKSMDKSCPMGPWLVTKDEIPDIQNLEISCKLNGVTVQSSHTSLMMFSVSRIISELSHAMTLIPGDIILTGTPEGIGAKRNPPLFLESGDIVEVYISSIGRIENKII